jgi:hypothetical protein
MRRAGLVASTVRKVGCVQSYLMAGTGRALLSSLVVASILGVASVTALANSGGHVLVEAVERQSCRFDRIVATEQQDPWTFYDIACKGTSRIIRLACTPDSCVPVSRPTEDEPIDDGQP